MPDTWPLPGVGASRRSGGPNAPALAPALAPASSMRALALGARGAELGGFSLAAADLEGGLHAAAAAAAIGVAAAAVALLDRGLVLLGRGDARGAAALADLRPEHREA